MNIVAKNEDEALLLAYKIVFDDLGEDFTIEDLRPILTQKAHYITNEDASFVLWDEIDSHDDLNRGIGWGDDVRKTSKANNIWIHFEKRTDENLHKALKGYDHLFEKLPKKLMKKVLNNLDKM